MQPLIPNEWRCAIDVFKASGVDRHGRKTRGLAVTVAGVLVAPGGSNDPTDFSDVTATRARAYLPPGVRICNPDSVKIPEGHPLAGVWQVDGDPAVWHTGTVLNLRKKG